MEFQELLNSEKAFFGATEHQLKLDEQIWEVLEDEEDGYRSSMGAIELKVSDAIFFKQPIATVKVWADEEIEGYKLVDVIDGHVWLRFGTDHSDSYYPWFVFDYQPKASAGTVA